MNLLKNLFIAMTLSLLLPSFLAAQHHDNHDMDKVKNHKSQKSQLMMHYDASSDFQNQLKDVFEAYIDIKDALVASETGQASEKAKMVAAQLNNVDGADLDDDAKQAWKKWSGDIHNMLIKIQSAEDIKTQRMVFANLSNTLYHVVRSFDVKDLEAYYQFCPMAQNGEGAHWMSEDKAIRNPYFGSKMMKCGKTVEEL